MAGELLTAYSEGKFFAPHFDSRGVQLMMNQNSGNVFLTNGDCEVLMMNGPDLEEFYVSPYEGKEGFFDELLDEYADMHEEDKEWFRQIADDLNKQDELEEKIKAAAAE